MSASDRISGLIANRRSWTFTIFDCNHAIPAPKASESMTTVGEDEQRHIGHFEVKLPQPCDRCPECASPTRRPIFIKDLHDYSREHADMKTSKYQKEEAMCWEVDAEYIQGMLTGAKEQRLKPRLEDVYLNYYHNAESHRRATVRELRKLYKRDTRVDKSNTLETHIRNKALKAEKEFASEAGEFMGRRWVDFMKNFPSPPHSSSTPTATLTTTPKLTEFRTPKSLAKRAHPYAREVTKSVKFRSLRELYPEKYNGVGLGFTSQKKTSSTPRNEPTVVDLTADE